MSIEDVRKTAHVRDLIVARLESDVKAAYHRASQKAWRAAVRGVEVIYSAEELSAVELVERKLLEKLHHRRYKRNFATNLWR